MVSLRWQDGVVLAFHWLFAFVNVASLGYLFQFHNPDFGWYYRFLTIWGLTIQTVFFMLCGVCDILLIIKGSPLDFDTDADGTDESNARELRRHWLERHRDRFFSLVFPLGFFIGLAFWTLVYPQISYIIEFLPGGFWLAFHQHGVTWIAIFLEALLVYHRYGPKRVELSVWVAFIGVYLVWNLSISISTGKWIYPFQQLLAASIPLSIVLYAGLVGLCIGMFLLLRFLNMKYWIWVLGRAKSQSYEPLR